MPFHLFDYVGADGVNEFKSWSEGLETIQRAKLNERLDKLHINGTALFPEMLTGTPVPGILKLRVRGNVQLRPLLCKGPLNVAGEFTLLMGAKENGKKFSPRNAPDIANKRKEAVKLDPANRRRDHERVS